MRLSLNSSIQKQIDDRVRSGKYRSAEDVVAAAMTTLSQHESFGEFTPAELDAILKVGEFAIQNGEVMSGDDAFAELARRRALRISRTP